MVEVKKEGILIEKTDLGFECKAVFNPAAIRVDEYVYLFYRALNYENHSSIGFCKLRGPLELIERMDVPLILPSGKDETHGIEDPRVSKIDNLYYLTYTAYNLINALGALATSTDLVHFEKKGIIVPKITTEEFVYLAGSREIPNPKYLRYNVKVQGEADTKKDSQHHYLWNKNVIFFPRKINGQFVFMQRIKPDIQIVKFDQFEDLTEEFWQNYFLHLSDHIVLKAKYEHEVSYIGGGCPPIETELGWLVIYHGVYDTTKGYVYTACAALLDLENPQLEIARLPYPLFKPELSWELNGVVNNVCFPTGTAVFEDTLYIYYGAADERIAVASLSMKALLAELTLNL